MKKIYTLICFILLMNISSQAQYVTIPDTNFAAWLNTNIPSAMSNGNQMDTTNTGVILLTSMNISNLNIIDLSGIQYFSALTYLGCYSNQLTSISALPPLLYELDCQDNLLVTLPTLPNSLHWLGVAGNQLTSLPELPLSLTQLACSNNQLTELPILPNFLETLYCPHNQLTALPALPTGVMFLDCMYNNINCFPIFPSSIYNIEILENPFNCLPNYISAMSIYPTLLSMPLCIDGDNVGNPLGCQNADGIAGIVFTDVNNNCLKDSTEVGVKNISIKLFNNGNLVSQTNSFSNGAYYFSDSLGTYTVKLDTIGMPFVASCNIDSVVTLTNSNSLATDVNFGITCKPGYDVGVQSITTSGWVFPGQQHQLKVVAGDMSQWFNLNCAQGTSGQVQFSISGPVAYVGVAPNALVSTVTGNTFTYQIADFGAINNSHAFGLLFTTDTTAQAGDTICINATVTSAGNDNNLSNNNYQFCYNVINSYDPNMKEVYPVNVLPGYQDWFTYTIHFQNTGSAPAFNIRLADTLDSNFDLESFQVINYSHYNTVSLHNNNLSFRFPNIMLPDSTSNPEGSKGFVQYRIKPKPSLPLGTQIANTAHIYFDYNAPIVTNTTINEFTQTASIKENTQSLLMSIYPNPSTGKYYITLQKAINSTQYNLEVYNLLGELILNQKIQNQTTQIDLSQYPQGTYILKASGANQSFHQRIIKN